MEELPKITNVQILRHNEDIKAMADDGSLVQWLDEQLKALSKENPLLYKYLMEHTQKFAMGAIMVQDPHAIAVSLALEHLVLLSLIGDSYKETKEIKNFSDLMTTWFSDGIKGLDEFEKEE